MNTTATTQRLEKMPSTRRCWVPTRLDSVEGDTDLAGLSAANKKADQNGEKRWAGKAAGVAARSKGDVLRAGIKRPLSGNRTGIEERPSQRRGADLRSGLVRSLLAQWLDSVRRARVVTNSALSKATGSQSAVSRRACLPGLLCPPRFRRPARLVSCPCTNNKALPTVWQEALPNLFFRVFY